MQIQRFQNARLPLARRWATLLLLGSLAGALLWPASVRAQIRRSDRSAGKISPKEVATVLKREAWLQRRVTPDDFAKLRAGSEKKFLDGKDFRQSLEAKQFALPGSLRLGIGPEGDGDGDGGGAGFVKTPCEEVCQVGSMACGDRVTGSLEGGDCVLGDGFFIEAWSLEVTEASEVTVDLRSNQFDTFLFVTDSLCQIVGINDDCGPGTLNSCARVTVAPGNYFVLVTSFAPAETGSYGIDVACGPTFCEGCPPESISCGETISGNLSGADCQYPGGLPGGFNTDLYTLEMKEAGPVTIEMRSGAGSAPDTFLIIRDEFCVPFAGNDDCQAGNFDLSCVTLDLAAGSYIIEASSFDVGETGNYELEVTCPDIGFCRDCTVGQVTCGKTQSGSLSAEDCRTDGEGSPPLDLWTLEVDEFSTIEITLSSADFDSSLLFFDSRCEPIPVVDTCEDAGTACARITSLLPGIYNVGVTSTAADASGNYDLNVECRAFDPCADCGDGTVACGEQVTGELAPGDCFLGDGSFFDTWTFDLAVGQEVTIDLASTDFDTFLLLLASDCGLIATNDDADGTNSRLVFNLAPGTYFIVANSFSAGETGAYSVDVSCRDITFCKDCSVGAISCNQTVTGNLPTSGCELGDGSSIDIWRFDLPVDSSVDIDLRSSAFDTFLFLSDETCVAFAANDDCQGFNSCLSADLAAGTYYLWVNSFAPGESGSYALRVTNPDCRLCETCEVGTIACGETVGGALSASLCNLQGAGSVNYHRLELAEPTVVRIDLDSTAVDPFLAILDVNCRVLETNDDCDAGTLGSCLELTLDPGTYFVGASSRFPDEEGEYSVSVSCVAPGGQLPGDCTQDGVLDLSDGICLLGFLFLGTPASLPCGDGSINAGNLRLLDFDDNSSVDLSDGVSIFTFLFRGGPPHIRGNECTMLDGCPAFCSL